MIRLAASLAIAAVLLPADVSAQDCGCDHTIALNQTSVRGDQLGAMPGDTVCVTAGQRPYLRLQRFQGTAAAPITIKNCGGQVVIRNTDRAYALVVEDDTRHIHLTGTGDPAHTYGFKVSAPDTDPYPGVGLWFNGRSTNYEADHIEIHDTGFAGVMAKTDPLCDGSADQGTFTQRDVKLHHLYIHDTLGEGMYVGSTQAAGHRITCGGQQITRQPHFLEGIHIHDSIIEDTGWDGAQIGMARADCKFYRNTIRRVGAEGVQYQQQGLQIGTFSACDVYDNVITDGPVMGIIALGTGRLRIFNNIIARFGEDGIYANDNNHAASQGQPYLFWHNTISGYGRNALTIFGGATRGSGAANNLVIGAAPGISAGNNVSGWAAADTLRLATLTDARLDPATFAPAADSPARAAGSLLPDVPRDLSGALRPDPPAAGALEDLDPAAPDMGMPADMGPDMASMTPDMGPDLPDMTSAPDMGTPIVDMSPSAPDMPPGGADLGASMEPDDGPAGEDRGGATSSGDDGGCASAGGPASPSTPALLLAALMLLVRRGRRD